MAISSAVMVVRIQVCSRSVGLDVGDVCELSALDRGSAGLVVGHFGGARGVIQFLQHHRHAASSMTISRPFWWQQFGSCSSAWVTRAKGATEATIHQYLREFVCTRILVAPMI